VPVYQFYNATEEELAAMETLYRLFREEMERTAIGCRRLAV
jgi:hypothetical protein